MKNPFFKKIIRIKIFIFMSLVLGACGQKGDLYQAETKVSLSPQAVKQPAIVADQAQARMLDKEVQKKQAKGYIPQYK